ncbi:polyribonucleotide nucleotidyltransferase, partial [Salmonella enterica subsp. enterica serovar Panama]
IKTLCEAQNGLADRAAKETQEFPLFPAYGDDVFAAVEKAATKKLEKLLTIPGKQERDDATNEYMEQVEEKLLDQFEDLEEADASKQIRGAYNALMKQIVRQKILSEGFRIDGRGVTDIRDLSVEVDLVPRAHGSSLFERGETQ